MTFTFQDEEHVRRIVREEVKEEVHSQLAVFRSDMVTKLDKIISLMQKRDQETTVLSQHSEDHTKKIKTLKKDVRDHKKRITSLESSVTTNA